MSNGDLNWIANFIWGIADEDAMMAEGAPTADLEATSEEAGA